MPDWKAVKEAFIDRSKLSQAIYKARGYATPGMQDIENERESRKLELESAKYSAARRPVEDKIQDDNAAWAEEQRSFLREIMPLKQQAVKQGLADTMANAPLDRIAQVEPVANKVVMEQIMQNAGDDVPITPEDVRIIADDPRFLKARNLYIVGDLANKAEKGDAVAKQALDEQLQRMNMKLIDTPNGKVVHDNNPNATVKDIPYDRGSYMEQWHATMLPVITETAGRARYAANLQSAGGRVANTFTDYLLANGLFNETDLGHAADITKLAMFDGVKIDKNTPSELVQRIGREVQAFDTLSTLNEGLKSTDADEKRTIFKVITQKSQPGKDGKYPLGGKLSVVPTADAQDPGTADWRSVILSFTPEGAPPGTAPTIMQAPQMMEMLLGKSRVAKSLKALKESLESAKAIKEQEDLDKFSRQLDLAQGKADTQAAKPRTDAQLKIEAEAMAREALGPSKNFDDNQTYESEVKRRAASIYLELKTGKPAQITEPDQSPDDYINNAIGE